MVFTLALLLGLFTPSQAASEADVVGYWTGAMVQAGTPIPLTVAIEKNGKELTARTEIPEWLWYDIAPNSARLTANGLVIEEFYGGDAVLEFEPRFRQLVGIVGHDDGDIRLHLKPAPPPPAPAFNLVELSFAGPDGALLSGTLVQPRTLAPTPGILLLHGRGCGTRSLGEAKFYARYGIAALTFDKRGAGESEGDCESATHETTVEDAKSAFRLLTQQLGVDADRIGLRGTSAGAWTAQALFLQTVEDDTVRDAAFIVTWIGPSTSIRQQQLSSAATVAEAFDLPSGSAELAQQAVRVATDESLSDEDSFARLKAIRDEAEREGWSSAMFAEDDLPETRSELDQIYLRRFRFDPSGAFQRLGRTPYLAVFGEDDPIVPLDENLIVLKALKAKDGRVEARIVPGQGHSLEHGDQFVDLPSGTQFFKNDTVEPAFLIETIAFLRAHGFVEP